jgi:uncharacterized protein (DUF488 family)
VGHEIWTIGHSNRPFEEFLALLRGSSITCVADVRRFTGSSRHPQFGLEQLEPGLGGAGIGYRHFPGLGGRRGRRAPESPNRAWRVESFNAFADHMETSEFRADLESVSVVAQGRRVAIMCSEALPWRCHRRLIADAFVVLGWTVWDIVGPRSVKEHTLTDFAHVEGGHITYPSEETNGGPS